MMELKYILEAVLFAAQKPLTTEDLKDLLAKAAEQSEDAAVRALRRTKVEALGENLETLAREHEAAGRSYRLTCVAGAWQFASQPEYAPWLRVLAGERARPSRLSQPALETLTIVAYRQPVTRAEIEQIRGVSADGVMQTLLERGLIEAVGRAEVVGRPMQYGTSRLFLEYFGLRQLDDLPAADELRRVPVEHPPSLLTVDPGLATAPPEQLTLQPQPDAAATPPAAADPNAPSAPASSAPPNESPA